MKGPAARLLEGFGVELEYMIVDRDTLDPLPLADRLLADCAKLEGVESDGLPNQPPDDVMLDGMGWSNELVMHVIEFKTMGPRHTLAGLDLDFHRQVQLAGKLLENHNARLLPTAMHPWLDPIRSTRIWPYGNREIYQAYNRIFDCRGHGWSNLQSMHLNLAFADDHEFKRLHSAIRLILPLIPALAASSPLAEGQLHEWMDARLHFYRRNQARIPQLAGAVIPEAVMSRSEYTEQILWPAWDAIRPHDPDGILRGEWLNSRGAIARWDRWAIEIRLIDLQECPRADLAIAGAVTHVLRQLIRGRWADPDSYGSVETADLAALLWQVAREGENARLNHEAWLDCFGLKGSLSASEIWLRLLNDRKEMDAAQSHTLDQLLEAGTLSSRIRRRVGTIPERRVMHKVYCELADCLASNEPFVP